jgi:hypothetical protein
MKDWNLLEHSDLGHCDDANVLDENINPVHKTHKLY